MVDFSVKHAVDTQCGCCGLDRICCSLPLTELLLSFATLKLKSQETIISEQTERQPYIFVNKMYDISDCSAEHLARLGMNPYLLVADGIGHARAGARHPRLGGDPLALQLGRVGGYHSLGHQHGWQVSISC